MDAGLLGVKRHPQEIAPASAAYKKRFRPLLEGSQELLLVIDPRPGLHIVDMTPSFEAATLADRGKAMGGMLFEVFPDNPEVPDADGARNVLNSLRAAARSGRPQAMGVQRYDVRNADGPFVERYWRPFHAPIFDEAGVLVWLLIRLEDVTAHNRA
jgi:PAS domain-containing protein